MGRAIFISYRREDTEGEAGRLFDDLTRSFGESSVFMDVAGINPGMDFRKAIDDNVATCGVLLAVIGPGWATASDQAGARRLDDPNDFVRLEIASALAREVAVIPVLVHNATMPKPDQLPENLKELAFRNSVEITHARWNSDVGLLTAALGRYVSPSAAMDTAPVHATVAVQLPPPTAPAAKPDSARRSNLPLILGIVVAAVLAIGIFAFLHFKGSGDANNPVPAPTPVPASSPVVSNELSAFAGTWNNPSPQGNNTLDRLEISPSGNQLSIHGYGGCKDPSCDWGVQTAVPDSEQQATATWNITEASRKRSAVVTIKPVNGQLSVSVSNNFSDRTPTHRQSMFVKAQ